MPVSGLHLLVVSLTGISLSLEADHWAESNREKTFCSWKCLIFTLQWPGSFCVNLRNSSDCKIPPNVSNWTVHGLWPQRCMSCCSCWPIFQSDLKEVYSQLSQLWPSLLRSHSSFQFWKNEWIKHGVCAACVEGMNSPLLYFQITLKLRAHFDIHQALDAASIKPSCEKTYEHAQIYDALAPDLGDRVVIQCMQDDKGRELWVQVKVPLSRNLTLGCAHPDQDPPPWLQINSDGHPCPKEVPLYYFPINYDFPDKPCD